jgi:hypothetical protein
MAVTDGFCSDLRAHARTHARQVEVAAAHTAFLQPSLHLHRSPKCYLYNQTTARLVWFLPQSLLPLFFHITEFRYLVLHSLNTISAVLFLLNEISFRRPQSNLPIRAAGKLTGVLQLNFVKT